MGVRAGVLACGRRGEILRPVNGSLDDGRFFKSPVVQSKVKGTQAHSSLCHVLFVAEGDGGFDRGGAPGGDVRGQEGDRDYG
jgi:hypothetical protein